MPCPSHNPMSPIVSNRRQTSCIRTCTTKTVPSRGGYRLSYCCFAEESGNVRQLAATSQNSKSGDCRPEQNQGVATIGNRSIRANQRLPFFKPSLRSQVAVGSVMHPVQVVEPNEIVVARVTEGGHRNGDDHIALTASTIGVGAIVF